MENTSAEWMSKQCGLQRIERLVESFAATWAGNSKGQSVRTEVVDVALFIPSVFMGLADMRGILRHGNSLVLLHLPHLSRVKRCEAFIPREDVPTIVSPVDSIVEAVEEEEEPLTLSGSGGIRAARSPWRKKQQGA